MIARGMTQNVTPRRNRRGKQVLEGREEWVKTKTNRGMHWGDVPADGDCGNRFWNTVGNP